MEAKAVEMPYVDAFRIQLADIADVELDTLQALSVAVRWPHRADDWQLLRELGHGVVGRDEIGRVIASAMFFPHGDDFATIGMLITLPRLQANGAAKWLTQRVLANCRGRKVRLNATREARRLYNSLGFVQRRTVFQCQGEAMAPAREHEKAPGMLLRRLERGDLAALVAFDAPAFAVPRAVHLDRLFEESIAFGLFEGGRLRAYSMARRFGRGHVVGPVAAIDETDAIAVVQPHVRAHAGTFLRLDTHFETGPFADYVHQCGMPVYDTVTTMTLGDDADYGSGANGQPVVFALASQTLG